MVVSVPFQLRRKTEVNASFINKRQPREHTGASKAASKAKPRRRSLKSNVYLSANETPFSLYNRITICIPLNVAIRPIETRLFYWPINRISFA